VSTELYQRFVKVTFTFFIISLFLFANFDIFAKEEPKTEQFLPLIDKPLSQTIEYIFIEDYASADSVCKSIIQKYPEHPAGYFMQGIKHWRKSYFLNNYNDYNDSTLFWLKKAVKIAKNRIEDNSEDPLAYFFAGGAYGYEGSVYARRKSWISTGRAAYRGIRSLEKSMQLDSNLYDIYYGSGLYHVLASHQPGVVKWIQKILPIPEGDSNLGVSYLQLAIEKGQFTSLAAKAALALAFVYYENRYQEAIELLDPLVETYPENLDFLTSMINAHFYRELSDPVNDWDSLLKYVNQIRSVVKKKDLDFQRWWLDKFDFIEAYANYIQGDYLQAETMLTKYCNKYSKKGKSYLAGLGFLTLGKLADLNGNREQAIKFYKKVKKLENMGNEKQLAKLFIETPFQKESETTRFLGTYVDLPDRP
jgi:tetratricopeptide (TPR) repeat protein